MEGIRCYFVIDMKSFFASVECALRGLDAKSTKLVVADSTRSLKTICLAVSPAMKALGVKNRCRLFEIPQNIEYIIAPPQMKKYIEYASLIYKIYLNYFDPKDIHVYSIDECFIDVTSYLKLYNITARDFAKKLMNEIWEKLKIPSSCGIGTNLYLAKIALDITAKHSKDAIGFLSEQKFKKELWHHKPLTDFWGISTGISERLKKHGIEDMWSIAHFDEDVLFDEFGINAELLIDHSKGVETCLMEDIKSYKAKSNSFSSSQILPCAYTKSEAKIVLNEMLMEGCYRLVSQNKIAKILHIFVSFEDKTLPPIKKMKRFDVPTNLPSVIEKEGIKLFDEICEDKNIRRLGYDFSEILDCHNVQANFFTDYQKEDKEKNLLKTIVALKNKFGKNAILRGIDFEEKATQRERNKQIGGHKSGEN